MQDDLFDKDEKLPDTIHSPEVFKKSLPEGFDGVCDFKKTSENIARRNITPMDFDSVVEINRHYLIQETKGLGVEVPPGQRQSLENLRDARSITLIYRWPKERPAKRIEVLYDDGRRKIYKGEEAEKKLTAIEKRWGDWADNNKTLIPEEDGEAIVSDEEALKELDRIKRYIKGKPGNGAEGD